MSIYTTTYLNSMSSLGFLTDRLIGDDVKLPHTFRDIKVKPNTILTSNAINDVFELINENFLYLISYGKIPTTLLPINNTHYLSGTGSLFNYQPAPTNGITTPNYTPSGILADTIDLSFTEKNDGTTAGLICSTTSVALVSSETHSGTSLSADLISTSSSIGKGLNSFTNIKAVDTQANNAFILNDYSVYKYDISGITEDDTSISTEPKGRYLLQTLGGQGNIADNAKFENPINISLHGSSIYVLDQKLDYTKTFIKKFDLNFNLQNIYNISENFYQIPVVDIMASDDNTIILSPSGRLVKYDNTFKSADVFELKDIADFSLGDNYKRLVSSKDNNNIFYILSDKNIFKRFKSKPLTSIGRFRTNKFVSSDSQQFAGISVCGSVSANDELFISDTATASVYRSLENASYQNAFYDTFESQIFTLSSIQINQQENVSNFTFNKSFSKILFNHFVLKENGKSKFQGTFDANDDLLFDGIKYPTDEESSSLLYETTLDNYIGINEIVLSETINRPIEKIYELQESIADFLQTRKTNTFPISSKVVVI